VTVLPAASARLWPWSVFAAMIAAAGLPIYIHAPKFYVDSYGVSLASLGFTLAALRLIDVVQDPALGWLADSGRRFRGPLVWGAVVIMALAMLGLFAVTPPFAPLAWFALTLALLFSGFSFLTIVFYAQGVEKAAELGPSGHFRLAGWRESGSLLGVSLAAVAPVVLGAAMGRPFTGLCTGFCRAGPAGGMVHAAQLAARQQTRRRPGLALPSFAPCWPIRWPAACC